NCIGQFIGCQKRFLGIRPVEPTPGNRRAVARLVFPREMQQISGVTKDAVQSTLHAQPFKPFLLRLTDGTLIPVPHPEFMVLSQGGRTAIVNTEGEKFSIIDLGLVTTIELGS